MQVSPVEALRELEPILREIEAERSQQVHQFAQITLWSVVIGGLLSLALAVFQVGVWAFAPLGIALIIVGVAYSLRKPASGATLSNTA
jgi:fatty acid desaturase